LRVCSDGMRRRQWRAARVVKGSVQTERAAEGDQGERSNQVCSQRGQGGERSAAPLAGGGDAVPALKAPSPPWGRGGKNPVGSDECMGRAAGGVKESGQTERAAGGVKGSGQTKCAARGVKGSGQTERAAGGVKGASKPSVQLEGVKEASAALPPWRGAGTQSPP